MNDNHSPPDTTEPKTIVAEPLVLAETTPEEERLEAVRALMMNGYGPILEACIDNLPLPAQREAFFTEAAHFLVFYLAVQLVDERGQAPEFKPLMQAFRVLHRNMERVIMQRFLELQGAYREQAAS